MESRLIGSENPQRSPKTQYVLPKVTRFAGLGLAIIGLLNLLLVYSGRMPDSGSTMPGEVISSIFNLLIGLALAAGYGGIMGLARLRAWLGLIFLTPLLLWKSGPIEGVYQGLFCFALLLLLGENPGRLRSFIGTALMALVVGLTGLGGFFVFVAPQHLAQLAFAGSTDPIPQNRIVERGNFQLKFLDPRWMLLKDEKAKAINSLFQVWAVRPDADIHVAVLPEAASQLSLADYKAGVLEVMPASKLVSEEEHPRGVLLRFQSQEGGIAIERLVLLVVAPTEVYQVHCWSVADKFSLHEPEFRAILQGFQVK